MLVDFPIYSISSRLMAGSLGSVVFLRSLFRAGSGESTKSTTSTSPKIGIHHKDMIKELMLYIYKMLSQHLGLWAGNWRNTFLLSWYPWSILACIPKYTIDTCPKIAHRSKGIVRTYLWMARNRAKAWRCYLQIPLTLTSKHKGYIRGGSKTKRDLNSNLWIW